MLISAARPACSSPLPRALVEHSTDIVAVLDELGRINYVSPAVERALGWSPDEVRGELVFDYVHPNDRAAIEESFRAVLASAGQHGSTECRIRCRDGAWRDFELVGNNRLDDPEVRGVIYNARDVTDRKRADAELREALREKDEALALLDLLVNTAPVGFGVVDLDLRFRRVNDQLASMNGVPAEDHIGRAVADVLPNAAHSVEPLLRSVLETGVPVINVERTVGPEVARPRPGHYLVSYYPLRTRGGETIGIGGLVLDVTERKEAEAGLRLIATGSQCLLWYADVADVDGRRLAWTVRMSDEVAAERLFPVARRPGESFQSAWYRTRIEEDRDRVDEYGARCVRANESYSQEYRCRRLDGDIRWLREAVSVQPVGRGRWQAVGVCMDVTERRRTEEALRVSELRFRKLLESGIIGVVIGAAEGRVVEANDAFLDLVGYTREDLADGLVRWDALTAPEYADRDLRAYRQVTEHGHSAPWEKELLRKDGSRVPVLCGAVDVGQGTGLGIALDLRPLKRLEEQLVQAQKMESIGRLAGGIAHDFNNLLAAVLGYCELASGSVNPQSEIAFYLDHIEKSAMRAAELTRQLLAFARQQMVAPQLVDLNRVVADVRALIQPLMGDAVQVQSRSCRTLWPVRVDPGQIEQVLFNLAVNARDAMPDGGVFRIGTDNVTLDERRARRIDAQPGEYACITATDTGVGMTPEVRSHVFEPFFTTKEPGRGTGLGLSMCYGIVKQAAGYMTADGKPGAGATFRIYLPRAIEPATSPDPTPVEPSERGACR